MPTYRVKCKDCSNTFDELAKIETRNGIKCFKCGGDTEIQIVSVGLCTTMFGRENKPLVLEHMTEEDDDIVSVTTKSQLKEECKKHNCISPILD